MAERSPVDDAARGIVFPRGADGQRSTLAAGRAIFADALAPLSAGDAKAARDERHWRRAYPLHVRRWVEGALVAGGEAALAASEAGLASAWRTMQSIDADGVERPLEAWWSAVAARGDTGAGLVTHTLRGRGPAAPAPWTLPYRGEQLAGDALRRQVDTWVANGIIEPSAGAALHRCAAQPQWFDLSDRTMVLLGAASEAGPLRWLARWRANIVAVDVPRPDVWRRIAAIVGEGNATLHAPLHAKPGGDWVDVAGVDLTLDAAPVARWLRGFDTALDVAALAYLDGERHVRVAMAMDWVQRDACAARADTTLAFMATPTDVFAVPRDAAEAAMARYAARPSMSRVAQGALHLASGERFFQPNVERLIDVPGGPACGVVDSLVLEQGPNYALAKRLQQWRALLARERGHRVSLNIAPSTTTASVVKNPALAAGFAGADTFDIEVFEPATTNALAAALWVHDLRCDDAAANPARPLAHPFDLFAEGACHGGLWRQAYVPRTALPFAAVVGWWRQRR